MIRVTLHKDAWTRWGGWIVPPKTETREFKDPGEASNWFIHDSYFDEPYTRKAVWEQVQA